MKDVINWIENTIAYKHELNEKYRELSQSDPGLYDGRILWGSGYIEALRDVLIQLDKEGDDNPTPD